MHDVFTGASEGVEAPVFEKPESWRTSCRCCSASAGAARLLAAVGGSAPVSMASARCCASMSEGVESVAASCVPC
jgi:hypothetical protein